MFQCLKVAVNYIQSLLNTLMNQLQQILQDAVLLKVDPSCIYDQMFIGVLIIKSRGAKDLCPDDEKW